MISVVIEQEGQIPAKPVPRRLLLEAAAGFTVKMGFWMNEVTQVYAYRNRRIPRQNETLTIALVDLHYNCVRETVT